MTDDLKTRVERKLAVYDAALKYQPLNSMADKAFREAKTLLEDLCAENQRLEQENAALRHDNAILRIYPEMMDRKLKEALAKSLAAKGGEDGSQNNAKG